MTEFLRILAFLIGGYSSLACAQGSVHFVGEDIDFALTPASFSVRGLYTFAFVMDKTRPHRIVYPFPCEVKDVMDLAVVNVSTNTTIPFEKRDREIVFHLDAGERDTVEILISYRQKASRTNVYILRSTQAWKKPLRFANYSLAVAKGIEISGFSYKPDSRISEDSSVIYRWSKKSFMPTKDFIVTVNSFPDSKYHKH